MDTYQSVVLIDSFEIINIVRLALSKIDPRLVDHGERVSYIARKIWERCPNREDYDPKLIFVLSVLHDIGAYKTDEIDDLVRFETEKPYDHCLFGYLFLKNASQLSNYAQALLYHHTDYDKMPADSYSCAKYAQLIHVADRADILLQMEKPRLDLVENLAGTRFDPIQVAALLQAEEESHISQHIRSGHYQEEVKETARTLRMKNEEILDYLKLLVYAIDFRSPYTVTHTADTTIISRETGLLMGLSDHELEALHLAAFLHDIGKIAIPYHILEKPGRLTAEEFAVVQGHISEGEQILRGVVSDEICDIALFHHEKMDGSGYCRGLTGAELTLPQRILAVGDVLSALSQPRSYKPAYPKEKVISILTEMKDRGHLCPQVVDVVCANYDMILANTERSHDPIKTLYADIVEEFALRRRELTAAG